ncbi:adenine deaminase C-terminal domain-containing protein [Rummeliibacillus sp. TYF005]|uniref:adenine deaminase C-terminal domain-containing protein n=1 Tax=Rummeliibacillus sp. TYF005 TaxID=2058214 RepID=UPI000F5215AE|nr:adenine deaminase C-terminal domain-containing protein [Rummeliibacillus sp. TYF005]RPJ94525.1 adenine deaminase [Rummeliibacillus sp. TYF005]
MIDPAWKIGEIRQQIAVIDGKIAPSIVLTNARYLHSMYKRWMQGNIWILEDRIVYAGPKMPANTKGTEIVNVKGQTIVPGYIEPHVHPFQLYNPQSLADYSAQLGTTTFFSDNMTFFLKISNKKAFSILDQLKQLPFSYYWWARFDSQTELLHEHDLFTTTSIHEWLERRDVLLGGELTGWPRLIAGDDQMLYWLQVAKSYGKKIEGHLPGASSRTLARMKLFGTDGDHESMTLEEVENRILHGYAVTLRHSSIRPDLPNLLKEILDKDLDIFDHLMMTTDGATPSFYENGLMDQCIQIALDAGVNPIDAYQMAAYNVARYYNMTDLHGFIATGRYATLNILQDEYHPVPLSVLSKGVWLKRDGKKVQSLDGTDFSALGSLDIDFDITEEDCQFSMPFGIEMVNDVITKPYKVSVHTNDGHLSEEHDECYLMLIDRQGKWRVNTLIKGFANKLQGFASSYSCTGDIILIGKDIQAMLQAFRVMKEMDGGIVIVENGEVVERLPLPIGGGLSAEPLEKLIEQEKALKVALAERGYPHGDAIYTLLFLQSTHLPYIRITQRGIFDVMKKKVLFPSVMR